MDCSMQYDKHWLWIFSLPYTYLNRSFWCAVKSKRVQLNICDSAAIAVCLAGEIFAYHANKQLHDFVSRNNKLKELGKGVVLILEGLWQYSQHPNHIGSSCGGDYSSSQGTWVMAGRLVVHSLIDSV